jgi:hypothetical protein
MASESSDFDVDSEGESWHANPFSDSGGEAPICPTQTELGDSAVLSSSSSSVNGIDISNMAEYVFPS